MSIDDWFVDVARHEMELSYPSSSETSLTCLSHKRVPLPGGPERGCFSTTGIPDGLWRLSQRGAGLESFAFGSEPHMSEPRCSRSIPLGARPRHLSFPFISSFISLSFLDEEHCIASVASSWPSAQSCFRASRPGLAPFPREWLDQGGALTSSCMRPSTKGMGGARLPLPTSDTTRGCTRRTKAPRVLHLRTPLSHPLLSRGRMRDHVFLAAPWLTAR